MGNILGETYISIRRNEVAKEPVYLALVIKPDGRREISSFRMATFCIAYGKG